MRRRFDDVGSDRSRRADSGSAGYRRPMSELRPAPNRRDRGQRCCTRRWTPRTVALGATMAPFGGWDMPISYAGAGVVAEHTAVRTAVGIFDVSHLGKASVTGPGAAAFVNRCLTADLGRIGPGQAQYTMCCNDAGGVIDDLIAYLVVRRRGLPDSQRGQHRRRGRGAAGGRARRTSRWSTGTPSSACSPCRGRRRPRCCRRSACPPNSDYMSWADADCDGRAGPGLPDRLHRRARLRTASRPGTARRRCGTRCCTRPALRGGLPAGLGARDTLRTEMGYAAARPGPVAGDQPGAGRVGWAVGWRKPEFFGRDALLAEKAAGPARASWGSAGARPRHAARRTCRCWTATATGSARLTSGTHSPTLGQGIGLALIDTAAGVGEGDEMAVDVRGRRLRGPAGQAAVRAVARPLTGGSAGARIAINPILGLPTKCDRWSHDDRVHPVAVPTFRREPHPRRQREPAGRDPRRTRVSAGTSPITWC